MAKCMQCGQDYEAKRSTSSYCSPKCKQVFYRNRMRGPVTITDAKPVTVTGSCCVDHEHNFTGEITKPKRGKDIKVFADLPVDVQETIAMMSRRDGKIDPIAKANRTAIAIHYQHVFPDSYEPTSDLDFTMALAQAGPGHVRVSKPGDADYEPQCETTRAFIEGVA